MGPVSAAAATLRSDRKSESTDAVGNVRHAENNLWVDNLRGSAGLAQAEEITPGGLTGDDSRSGQPAKQGKGSN